MRFDLPHEIPRRRQRENAPLEPGPVERRREQLDDRALENRGPQVKQPKIERPRQTEPSRQIKDRAVLPDRHLDHRPRRNDLPSQAVDLSLRAEEQKVLSEVARFRVIATRDLAETIYGNRPARMERDLAFLVEHGLVNIDAVNARRDGRGGRVEHLEVVTLTKAGRNLMIETGGLPEDQQLYAGLVKPREVEHDTQIYRAYLKEAQRIEGTGGTNLRVRLDFELKAGIQKAIHAERKAAPERDLSEIKQQVAERFDLPFVDNGIQIPDARIEYDTDQGSRSGHADIEVLTAAYRPGHIRGKAQAGFSLYASASDRATLTAKIENEHHLLDNILEL
jgi:hypothetical protein